MAGSARRSRFKNERHSSFKLAITVCVIGAFALGWAGFAAAQPDPEPTTTALSSTPTPVPTRTAAAQPQATSTPSGQKPTPTQQSRTSRGS